MSLKPMGFAPREDGKCVCGFDSTRIRANSAGRFFCLNCGHEWEEDRSAEAKTVDNEEAAVAAPLAPKKPRGAVGRKAR